MARFLVVNNNRGRVTLKNGETLIIGRPYPMGLGSIELRNTKTIGLHIVRLSKKGHHVYKIRLTQDGEYRLGPKYGHFIVPAEKEKNPFKRILRRMEIPVSKLEIMDPGASFHGSVEHDTDYWREYSLGNGCELEPPKECGKFNVTVDPVGYAIELEVRELQSANRYIETTIKKLWFGPTVIWQLYLMSWPN